jgi:predicted dehydrogenase
MSKPTRRSFLEHTLYLAAAGMAVAQKMPTALADTATGEGPGSASSDEKVRVAVVGLHSRGLTHVQSFAEDPSVEVVALCDVDDAQFGPAQAKLRTASRPPAKQYKDLRKIFDDPDIHAVSIATPNHWHALAGIWGMQAGKDMYVEKPIGHNITEGRRLEQARLKYDRICAAGTQSRSNKAIQAAIQYIHDGKLGDVKLARALCYKTRKSIGHFADSATPAGIDYDIWLGPAPVRPFNQNRFIYNWHWNWTYGNGDIGNQGIHQIDVCRWALKGQLPTSALSVGGRYGYEDDAQTPNTQLAFWDLGGPQLTYECRGLTTGAYQTQKIGSLIYGTEGFIAIDANGISVLFDKEGKMVSKFKGAATNHFSNFAAAVRSRKQSDLHAPILEGHYSAGLSHTGNASYRLGTADALDEVQKKLADNKEMSETFSRFEQHLTQNALDLKSLHCQSGPALTFDAQAENFGTNAAANAMLTREYREPFVVPATL